MKQQRVHNLTLGQVRTLSSSTRQAIVRALARIGACTAADLSEEIGTSRSGLYYHLERLIAVHLVTEVESRPGTTRPERVFALVHRRMQIGRSSTRMYRLAVSDMLNASLRALGRQLSDVIGSDSSGASYAVRQIRVRLSKKGLRKFHQRADTLIELTAADKVNRGGVWQEILILQVPDTM